MPAGESEVDLIIVAGTFLLLLLVSFIVVFMLFYQNRYFRQERRIKEIREESERELLKAQLEIQEVELKRVSLEIHDNAGQMLSLVKLNLNVLEARMPQDDPDTRLLSETKTLVGDIITDLRNLSKSLSSDLVERYGLIQALKFETERISLTEQYHCAVIVNGASWRLPLESEIILFRMLQECLQNIIRHSLANAISIELSYSPEILQAEISDNGVGFDIGSVLADKYTEGSGIRNLYSRAKLIAAWLDIISAPGEGARIRIKVPADKLAGKPNFVN